MSQSISFSLSQLVEFLSQSQVRVQAFHQGQSVTASDLSKMNLTGLGSLERAQATEISFIASAKYASQLEHSEAGVVFVRAEQLEICPCIALVTDNPYLAYALASQFVRSLLGDILDEVKGIHPTAIVHDSAQVGRHVSIGPGVVIGENAIVGDRVTLGAYSIISKNVTVGEDSKLAAHVVLYSNTDVGARCRIQSQTSIGADGFGYAPTAQGWEPIAQLGGVIVGDDVHIGANTSIDRGAIHPTEIHNGVIIDNQVQIAHNVIIGEHTAIAGCVGIAGSTEIGARCTLAGAAGVAGHLKICDGTHIGMQAQVTKSITEPGQYGSGTGLYPLAKWRRLVGRLRRLI